MLLDSPPLARAPGSGARIDAEQRTFRRELGAQLPSARLGWRYRLVANGYSVTLPRSEQARLRDLPGVRDVLPTATYAPRLISTPQQIGASALWGESLETAGQGVKIGIIDSGIDPDHPYFAPAGYTMPTGFPKGQQRFTTAKVIVARAFPPSPARRHRACGSRSVTRTYPTAPTSQGSRRATQTPRPAVTAGSRGWPRAPISATTRSSSRPTRGSVRMRTPPPSSPPSRRLSPTE